MRIVFNIYVVQKRVEQDCPGAATIVPIIISTDKTQLTTFHNKSAYPVYLTLGNIPKEIRRKPSRNSQILLGYLPTSRLEHITSVTSRRRTLTNLFHACMWRILSPLRTAGADGVIMRSGDGVARRCHPILAAYVGDYLEQTLVTGTKNGECPTCPATFAELGDPDAVYEPRDLAAILEALASVGDPVVFARACRDAGIKPIYKPFWEGLPYSYIFRSITPDVLHQLLQGFIKHLKAWLLQCYSRAEIDARCRRMPLNHNIRHFANGISQLSRLTGGEHDQISRILLGLIIGLHLPDNRSPARLLGAVRGALDFLFLAQYPSHTTETLDRLDNALTTFHENKDIFIDLGIRAHFRIPKFHNIHHYRFYIELYGTTDNFNTEYTERLHIDLAKNAYRATNFKDIYPQMSKWLERHEKIIHHYNFIQWRIVPHHLPPQNIPTPQLILPRNLKMTKHPSRKSVRFTALVNDYGATFFTDALARYLVTFSHPNLPLHEVEQHARYFAIPFQTVPVFHKIKYTSRDPYSKNPIEVVVDSIHAQPRAKRKKGDIQPARFDTALINDGTGDEIGLNGMSFIALAVFPVLMSTFERI